MPIEIKYLHGGRGIEVIGKGVVTGEEIFNGNRTIYSGDTLSKHKYQIVNLADAERVQVSREEAVKLANQDIEASKTNPDIVIAVVADLTHAYGLGRMWEVLANQSGFKTMVFRERQEAMAWISEVMPGL
jgi:hypothetical protein